MIVGAMAAALTLAVVDPPPGVVIDHLPKSSNNYIGSPSLAILSAGGYIAAHDFFGPGPLKHRTAVFASQDRGRTWKRVADVPNQFWSTVFEHRGKLYLLGTTGEYGLCVIRRSEDGGASWTEPKDARSGLLHSHGRYHCAPMPVALYRGRLWRAMEDADGPGGWGSRFRSFVMSVAEDADLLLADNWHSTNRLSRNPRWLDGKFGGWLEGNVVVRPDGGMANILRADYRTDCEKAAIVEISSPSGNEIASVSFDPDKGFVDFPGGCKKFTIRFDPQSQAYWTLSNAVLESRHRGTSRPDRVRNALYLCKSSDLRNWHPIALLLYHPDAEKHAFQYVDWQFEGDDIIAVSRTAWDDEEGGAHNQHDANFFTFHRFANFRRPGKLRPPTTPDGSGSRIGADS